MHLAAALLVFGLAITGFAEDAEISDLCAVASVEGVQAGESGTPEALVVACAASQPSSSTTIGIGNQTHTAGMAPARNSILTGLSGHAVDPA